MGAFKRLVSRGMYYHSVGIMDFGAWTQMMTTEFGPEIRPFIRHIPKWVLVLMFGGSENAGKRFNCWDFMGCGRHLGREGIDSEDSRACPSSIEKRLDGLHGGENAGRACWGVTDTLCRGMPQGSVEQKIQYCLHCDFYCLVMDEEKSKLISPAALMKMLHDGSPG